MAIKAIDPVSGKVLASYDEMTPTVVGGTIGDVHEAFLKWRRTSFAERATMMREAAKILRGSAGEYARLMAQEMGKPVRDGAAEVEKCASGCDFYAENAARFLAREPILTEAQQLRHLQPARCRARRDAVEFSVLAGVPLCGTRPDGWKRRRSQACLECPGMRAGDRGRLPPRRLSQERIS